MNLAESVITEQNYYQITIIINPLKLEFPAGQIVIQK